MSYLRGLRRQIVRNNEKATQLGPSFLERGYAEDNHHNDREMGVEINTRTLKPTYQARKRKPMGSWVNIAIAAIDDSNDEWKAVTKRSRLRPSRQAKRNVVLDKRLMVPARAGSFQI